MSFTGRYQLGRFARLVVACRNLAGSPAWPAEAPTVQVWNGTARVGVPIPIPARDRPQAVGLFEGLLFFDGRFAVGSSWSAHARYLTDAPFASVLRFALVEGGDPAGAVIALADHVLPSAHYLVQQTDAGLLTRGKNPYLP